MDLVPLLQALVAIDSTSDRPNGPCWTCWRARSGAPGSRPAAAAGATPPGWRRPTSSAGAGRTGPAAWHWSATPTASPTTAEWKEALSGELRDGKVCGRGAADTKAFLAAALVAVSRSRAGVHPLSLVFTADEEVGCLGAKQVLAEGRVHPRHAIVGEPTCLVPVRAHKGYCAVEVQLTGVEGHSAYPDVGASAIHALGRLWPEVEAIGGELARELDPDFTPALLHLERRGDRGRQGPQHHRRRVPLHLRVAPAARPGPAPRAAAAGGARWSGSPRQGGGRVRAEIAPLRTDPAAVTPPEAEVVRFLEAESGNALHHRPLRHRAARGDRHRRRGLRLRPRRHPAWPTGPASTSPSPRWRGRPPSWSGRSSGSAGSAAYGLGSPAGVPQRAAQRRPERRQVERLGQDREGALDPLSLEGARDHQHRHRRRRPLHVQQHVQPGDARHVQVEHEHVELLAVELDDRLGAAPAGPPRAPAPAAGASGRCAPGRRRPPPGRGGRQRGVCGPGANARRWAIVSSGTATSIPPLAPRDGSSAGIEGHPAWRRPGRQTARYRAILRASAAPGASPVRGTRPARPQDCATPPFGDPAPRPQKLPGLGGFPVRRCRG